MPVREEMYEFLLLGDKAGLDDCPDKLSKGEFFLQRKLNSKRRKAVLNLILLANEKRGRSALISSVLV